MTDTILQIADRFGVTFDIGLVANGDGTYSVATTGGSGGGTTTIASNGAVGSAAPTVADLVGGSDGTDLRALKVDSLGAAVNSDVPATITGSASSAAVILTVDTLGYNSVAFAISGFGSNTVVSEQSADNSNWVTVQGYDVTNPGVGFHSTPLPTVTNLAWPCVFRYFRLRVSTYVSGTVSAVGALRAAPFYTPAVLVSGAVNLVAIPTPSTTTVAVAIAPATPAAAYLKTTPGNLYTLDVGNAGVADVWLKLFNAGSGVTVGTTSPVGNFYVPKGTARTIFLGDIGVGMSAGIGYAVTGAIALLDTTVVAANTVTVTSVIR
jgi:hypothetical protein